MRVLVVCSNTDYIFVIYCITNKQKIFMSILACFCCMTASGQKDYLNTITACAKCPT